MTQYTRDHAWVRVEGEVATIGITDYAQRELGDIVYVDLPAAGTRVQLGTAMGTVESVKSVSELVAPLSGVVLETNGVLRDSPELLNREPEAGAWMLRVKLEGATEEFLDAAAYAEFVRKPD